MRCTASCSCKSGAEPCRARGKAEDWSEKETGDRGGKRVNQDVSRCAYMHASTCLACVVRCVWLYTTSCSSTSGHVEREGRLKIGVRRRQGERRGKREHHVARIVRCTTSYGMEEAAMERPWQQLGQKQQHVERCIARVSEMRCIASVSKGSRTTP